MSRTPRLKVVEPVRVAPHIDLLEIDAKTIAESLTERGLATDGEIADQVDRLQGALDSDVPIARTMRCAQCKAFIDREANCPFCDSARKTSCYRSTETGNAERLVALHGDRLRYCAALGGWFYWDGRRWKRDDLGRVEQLAKATVLAIYGEFSHVNDDERDELLEHARKSERANAIFAMIRLAQSDPKVATAADAFDRDPWLLNCTNGTLNLQTLELRPHDPADLLTKITGAPFDPEASSKLWNRAVQQWMGNDEDLVDFLRRALGYSIAGVTSEEKLFVVHGKGGGGKSTCIEAVRAVLGDYARTSDFAAFVKQKHGGGGPRNDIARLQGARFVSSIEVEDGAELAEALVKSITGGATITARFLYREGVEFRPQLTLWLVVNSAPRVDDRDSGMWRRLVRVPFDNVLPKEKRDPALKSALCDVAISGAAILSWLVRGCVEWQQDGLRIPASIEQATEDYHRDQDPLEKFFEDEILFDPNATMTRDEARRRYEAWAKAEGARHPLSPRTFNDRLRDRGLVEEKSRGVRGWKGARLVPSTDNVLANWNANVAMGAAGGRRGQELDPWGAAVSSEKQARGQEGQQLPITSHAYAYEEKLVELAAPAAPTRENKADHPAPGVAPSCPLLPPGENGTTRIRFGAQEDDDVEIPF